MAKKTKHLGINCKGTDVFKKTLVYYSKEEWLESIMYCGNTISPAEDWSCESQLKKEAEQICKHKMLKIIVDCIGKTANSFQYTVFTKIIIDGQCYQAVADELGKDYFTVYQALWGQKSYVKKGNLYGKPVGGLFPKVKKKLQTDQQFQGYFADLRNIYNDDTITILKYTEDEDDDNVSLTQILPKL